MTSSSSHKTLKSEENSHHTSQSSFTQDDVLPFHKDLVESRVAKARLLLTLLVLYLLADYLYLRQSLFQVSIEHAKILREQYPSRILDLICLITSEFGDKYAIGIILCLGFNVLDLPKSFILTLATATGQSLVCLLKSFNNEARPFFVADIKPYKCRLEHGNPSGHSLIVVALYATIVEMICRQYQLRKTTSNVLWVIYAMFCLFMGFGRIYNGVHTYNQIISGYVWGLVIYYTFSHIFYYEICRFISSVQRKSFKELAWNAFTKTFLLGYILVIGLYLYGSTYHPTPALWIENIKKNCVNVDLHVDPELQNFEKYNICFSLIGALIGIALEQKFSDTKDFHLYFWTRWTTTMLRFTVGCLFGLIPLLPYLVSKHNPFWIVLLCKSILPTLLGNIHVYGFQKWVAHRLGLINTDMVPRSLLDREYVYQEKLKAK